MRTEGLLVGWKDCMGGGGLVNCIEGGGLLDECKDCKAEVREQREGVKPGGTWLVRV